MWHRYRYIRSDVQRELVDLAIREGLAHQVDAEGFVRVSSEGDMARLDSLRSTIDDRKLLVCWHFLSDAEPDPSAYVAKRREQLDRGVLFLEYEAEGETDGESYHMLGLAIQRESSLPPSERPSSRRR